MLPCRFHVVGLALVLALVLACPGRADPPDPRPDGFERDGFTVNDNGTNAFYPAVAFGNLTGDAYDTQPWVAFAQESNSPQADILVKTYDYATGQWQRRGAAVATGSLNRDRGRIGERPALGFAGHLVNGQGTTPWVAFNEVRPDQLSVPRYFWDSHVYVRRLVQTGQGEQWVFVGQDRGAGGQPFTALNVDPAQNAVNASLAVGPIDATTGEPGVWVAWDEDTHSNRLRQVYVRRAAPDMAAGVLGGYRWDLVGRPRGPGGVPSVNVSTARLAERPHLVFAGADQSEPWLVWQESDVPPLIPRITDPLPVARIYAAQGVPDASAPGGYRWETRPACPDGITCALNRGTQHNAQNARLAVGALPDEDPSRPLPWAVWQETVYEYRDPQLFTNIIRHIHIYVSRWDGARWRPVGGPLNITLDTAAINPDIVFVDHIPYVGWSEEKGRVRGVGGEYRYAYVYVARLADWTPGRERWELVTNVNCGANFVPYWAGDRPALTQSPAGVYLAWQESGLEFFPPSAYLPRGQPIFAAQLVPDRPAGCNIPLNTPTPFVTPTLRATRTPSPTPLPTNTATPPPTATPTRTPTATLTATPTPMVTQTVTPTWTATPSRTPSPTDMATATATRTATPTFTITATSTPTLTSTPTFTLTSAPSPTPMRYRLYLPYLNTTRVE